MSLNADVSADTNLSEAELAQHVIDATKEVFSTMVMMNPSGDYPLQEPVSDFKCNITGMVGFAGTYMGVISIHCPVGLAMKITSNMLGMECDEVNEDLNDAIGEITNMLGGSIKHVLSKGGMDVKMSIPTVISGDSYIVNALSDRDCIIIPFSDENDRFLVGLVLKKDN